MTDEPEKKRRTDKFTLHPRCFEEALVSTLQLYPWANRARIPGEGLVSPLRF